MRFETFFGRTIKAVIPAAISGFVVAALFSGLPNFAEAANTFFYTALGDSLAFGAFAPIGQAYVPRYDEFVETDRGASLYVVNLGIPGWTSLNLVQALRTNGIFRISVFSSGVVTWDIGGNDLSAARNKYKSGTCGGSDNQDCMKTVVAALKTNWDGIIGQIRLLRRGRPTIIRTMNIYNPFVNIDKVSDSWPGDGVNDFEALKPYLEDVNAYIAVTAAAKGILTADVYHAFNGANGDEDPSSKGYLAFDGFHPNALGHSVIASLLRSLGYAVTVP
jgi:lysophospholipase L1-like esterase